MCISRTPLNKAAALPPCSRAWPPCLPLACKACGVNASSAVLTVCYDGCTITTPAVPHMNSLPGASSAMFGSLKHSRAATPQRWASALSSSSRPCSTSHLQVLVRARHPRTMPSLAPGCERDALSLAGQHGVLDCASEEQHQAAAQRRHVHDRLRANLQPLHAHHRLGAAVPAAGGRPRQGQVLLWGLHASGDMITTAFAPTSSRTSPPPTRARRLQVTARHPLSTSGHLLPGYSQVSSNR